MTAPYQPPETTPLYEQYLKEQRERARQAQAASTAPAKPDTAHPNETRGSAAEGMLAAPLHGLFPLEDEVGGAIGGGMNALLNLARGGKANLREEVNRAIEARRANLRAAHGVGGGFPAAALETAGAVAPALLGAGMPVPIADGAMGVAQRATRLVGANVGEAAPVGRAMTHAGNAVRGAGYAALQAAGNAEGGVGERLGAGARALPAGAVLGAALPAVTGAAYGAAGRIGGRTTEDRAVAILQKVSRRANRSPEQVSAEATQGDIRDPERLMDVMGRAGQRVARYAAVTPSEGGERIANAVDARSQERASRMIGAMEEAYGMRTGNLRRQASDMARERLRRAEPLYEAAFADESPIDVPELNELMRLPFAAEAWALAKRMARADRRPLPDLFSTRIVRNPQTRVPGQRIAGAAGAAGERPAALDEGQRALPAASLPPGEQSNLPAVRGNLPARDDALAGSPMSDAPAYHDPFGQDEYELELVNEGERPTARVLHYWKQALEATLQQKQRNPLQPGGVTGTQAHIIRGQLRGIRNTLRQNEAYRIANDTYAGDIANEQALEAGKGFVNMHPDDVEIAWQEMTPSEREHFREGALWSLTNTFGRGAATGGAALSHLQAPHLNRSIAIISSEPERAAIGRAVGRERTMQRTDRMVLGGSPTMPIAADVADATNSPVAEVFGLGMAGPKGYALAKLVEAAKRRSAGLNEKTVNALAPMLLAGPDEIPSVMRRVATPGRAALTREQRASSDALLSYLGGLLVGR